ncbi:hypothetical protein RND81_09G111300 [Saponaria officinalis]|uniref:Kinesin-like protein n=1 Tax=Saponaria officinalis TaxID=3572 RepID=A0AAW1ILD7_SAPOF
MASNIYCCGAGTAADTENVTGPGKTFTMEGTEQNRGINYRTLEQLFQIARERSDTFTYEISISVLEVYNEQIRDLLDTSTAPKKLEIKQDFEGSHHVPGIVEAKVGNTKQVWEVLRVENNARAVGSNNVNEHNCRSHCMLCVIVKAKNLIYGECTKSKLWLVDLAGSERLTKTDVQGDRLKEAQNINKSLSALGDVISGLANKSSHVPYRNSKLTHLLQDSLAENDLGESLSSLYFASRVCGVELAPARRQIDTSELQRIKTLHAWNQNPKTNPLKNWKRASKPRKTGLEQNNGPTKISRRRFGTLKNNCYSFKSD